jgi:hypothetical protein
MKVTVIDEVPVIEATVIEPTASKPGITMDATIGKTTHTTTHATHAATAYAAHMAAAEPAATADRSYSADMSGTHKVLEVRRACYRLS